MKNFTLRKSNERGFFNHGWLKSFHSFSFADYFDRNHMNFYSLRVINEDFIQAKNGFGFHPHNNMEIVTYIMRGSITHEDSLGNKEEIKTGEFQVMSAGSGIVHSEFNHGDVETHLLQIWIKPNQLGGEPSYKISAPNHEKKWALVASSEGRDGSFLIKQDADVYAINSCDLPEISFPESKQKHLWIQVAEGLIVIDGVEIEAGDGISFEEDSLTNSSKIEFKKPSKLILFAV